MAWTRTVLYSALSSYLWHPSNAEYIWPNAKIDELEKILYEVNGPFNSGPGGDFAENVSGCSGRGAPSGRNFGAEWLRTAYHDMATADVAAGTGGLDASILFELDRAENPGDAFSETFLTFRGAHTTRASVADLLAVASVMAVGACSNGQVIIPFKGGRVDAAGPGPSGVPEPQQDIASHTAAFARQGFDVSEMISLVACGHTIGGVHGVDFPEIVPNPPDTGTDNMVTFDTTNNNFDNSVAKEFVANVDQNPLAFGQNETTRSDFRIFNADGGKVISQMAKSEDFFLQTCNTLLERMINTVPSGVKLTDVIQPITIKPMMLQIEPNTTDGTLTVSGFVRLINTTVDVSQSQVLIHPKSRSGKLLPATTGSTQSDFVAACDIYPNCGPGFVFYQFNTTISAKDGISSFTVEVKNDAAGKTTQYTNGGSGFPFSDAIQLVNSLSKQGTNEDGSATTLNITALVLNAEDFSDVSLINYGPSNLTAPISPWIPIKTPMKALQKIPGTNFTLYTASWTGNNFAGNHPFDLVATGDKCTVSSLFNEVTGSGVGGGPGGGKSKSPGGKKSRR